jgi:tRNA modification GTPase
LTEDTVAALATAPGEGAISCIRISGPEALSVCDGIFRGKQLPSEARDRSVLLGDINDGRGNAIDQVLLTIMRGPGSFTGEDVVEITCHGGHIAPSLVLRRLLEMGIRPADPGEFTKRAFLNGKMDLAQAEAVCEIVRASSERAHRVALRQLKGDLSGRLESLENRLLEFLTLIEANIDFPDEDVESIDMDLIKRGLGEACEDLESLLEAHRRGRHLKKGLDMVIVGKPNVGKSSIFNRLVEKDRVIVSECPGTTRDVVDGLARVNGLMLRVHDTAGVRHASDPIEEEAVRRTREAVRRADLSLVVIDSSCPISGEDREILAEAAARPCLVAANKTDLPVKADLAGLGPAENCVPAAGEPVRISALKGWGFDELIDSVKKLAHTGTGTLNYEIIVSERHAADLRTALENLSRARRAASENIPPEFIASDLRHALDCLGEVTGRQVSAQVLDEIFSRFCIGK